MTDIEKKDHAEVVAAEAEYNPDAPADPAKYMRSVAVVSLWELWAYYLFYNGDNGGGPNGKFAGLVDVMINTNAKKNFIAHNATLSAADAFPADAVCGPDTAACQVGSGSSLIPQVSFSLMQVGLMQLTVAIILITLGGLGDYKLYGRTFLFWTTVVCIALHFAFVFINPHTGSMPLGVTLLFFCQVSYQMTLSFFFAAFPRLASHMPSVYEKIDAGATVREVDDEIALQRSRISMVSTYWSNIGWAVPLLVFLGVIFLLNENPDQGQTDFTYNANALLFGVYWLIFAIPYFILDKKRPGPDIPAGVNIYTEGLVQAREALRLSKKLPEAWWYILGFFLFCDGANSSGLILGGYLQGLYISYNVFWGNMFSLLQAVCSMIGCLVFWKVQQHYKLQTKTMLQASNLLTLLMYAWGIVGLFSKTMGYRSFGEFWFFNIGAGLWSAPFWALQNTYLADLIPAKKAYLFFGLFGIMNKCSAFMGPLVNFIITIIAPSTEADYIGFIPCTILSIIGFLMIQKTDPIKGRADVLAFEEAERELEAERLAKLAQQ
ncbi:UNVERIFIED_CONTAM: hypothetical protein HDU68_001499 [Siphonaria sp. JEL0065]|nr:hypothetical protein HDU68_001499 [Siphonaria sp. JEL0065]